MNAFTRGSCGSQSCVPSSEQESCTMCSSSTPCWSATDAMHSLSHAELRKLGVMMENFILVRADRFRLVPMTIRFERRKIVQTIFALSNLRPKFLRDRNPPAHAKRARRNLQARRGLPAFVFAEIDLVHHVIDHRRVKTARHNFRLAQVFHDIQIQNRVQNLIRRQRILIRLVRAAAPRSAAW